jgi:two-component system response regulator DesR
VLLVEDNAVYRETLEFLLGRYEDLEVVAAVADGSAAVRACAELCPAVAVVDYRLPDTDGLTAAAELREASPGTAIVLLSASAGAQERESARIAGMAFVRKDEGVDALLAAIRAATA